MKQIIFKIGIIFILCNILALNIFPVSIAATTVDSVVKGADDFISEGTRQNDIDKTAVSDITNFLYNLLLGIGIVVAVIVGSIIGIKYMIGSVNEKAELKQTLFAYLVGCIVVFGAFGIWKVAVEILSVI